jgi:hypothetical protein
MEKSKTEMNWLMNRYEQCSDRYIEAESFLIELAKMKWYKRFFLTMKILKFLNSRSKYNF